MLRRVILGVAALLAVMVVVGAAVGVVTVRRSFPQTAGELTLTGLDEPVEVHRDDAGVPTVVASTSHDLFLAQGFVHAQDRFWEMDFRRHVTAGRLSELFGASQVETDRFVRTLGWRRVAEQELSRLDDRTVAALEAYATGVNAYLDGRPTSAMSLEYAVLGLQRPGYRPEPWTPADSLAWLKAMAWDLRTNLEDELGRVLTAAEVGIERTRELYPDYPFARHAPIVTRGRVVDGAFRPDPSAGAGPAAPSPAVLAAVGDEAAALQRRLGSLPALLGPAGPGIGSNSWVVSGEHTASGEPLLANDPHLGPAMPSVWHQMRLRCEPVGPDCPYNVGGFTFSGVPGVVIGHNDRVAWGFTNLGADVTDLFVERVDGDRYRVDGRWRDMRIRTEAIEVAGGEDRQVTIRSTRHGPLLSDVSGEAAAAAGAAPAAGEDYDHALALRWTALDPGRTADAITRLNRAGSFEEFRQAARLFEVPAQNLVYADVDGHIGYQAPGRIPIRSSGRGLWPSPGWNDEGEWVGFVPFDELPWSLDPPDGRIVAANQRVVGPDYPHLLHVDTAYGYRSHRIRTMLERADGPLAVEDTARLQLDSRNLNAATLVPWLLDTEVPERVVPARRLLADWDLTQPAGSAAAAFFNATWRHLLAAGFHDELPEGRRPGGDSRWFEVVRTLPADSPWWDDVDTPATETRRDVLRTAMVRAHDELTDRLGGDPAAWRWGDLHTLRLVHESLGTSGIAPIEWLFNRGPLRVGGGDSLVNATGWTAPEGYAVDWVPSMRMVVDLGDLDGSRWVNLTGTSGHAFHPHYVDQAGDWRQGRTLPMRWDLEALTDAPRTLRLRPGGDRASAGTTRRGDRARQGTARNDGG